jgi:hypothetical protein
MCSNDVLVEDASTPILHQDTDSRGGCRGLRREWKERTVRTYDAVQIDDAPMDTSPMSDVVEVRKGPVPGYGADGPPGDAWRDTLRAEVLPEDGPQQFLWRGRLWQVREVVAHWVECGAWWLRRPEERPGHSELVREREVWRVTAARGRAVATPDDPGFGVFDLAFDGSEGIWRLAGSME